MKKRSKEYLAEVRNDAQVLLSQRELAMPTEEETYRQGVLNKLNILNDKVDSLDVKVSYTNGKVRWTEKMIYLSMGGLSVLSIVVFPLLFSLIQAGKL